MESREDSVNGKWYRLMIQAQIWKGENGVWRNILSKIINSCSTHFSRMSSNWLQVRRIMVLCLEKMHWGGASWLKTQWWLCPRRSERDSGRRQDGRWDFWGCLSDGEKWSQIIPHPKYISLCMWLQFFSSGGGISNPGIWTWPCACLVSEILTNVMQTEAGEILQMGRAFLTVLCYTVTTMIWISLGHLLDDGRHVV